MRARRSSPTVPANGPSIGAKGELGPQGGHVSWAKEYSGIVRILGPLEEGTPYLDIRDHVSGDVGEIPGPTFCRFESHRPG